MKLKGIGDTFHLDEDPIPRNSSFTPHSSIPLAKRASRSNEIDRDCATKVSTWRQSLEIEFFHRSRLFPRCLAARIISLASGTSLQLRPSLPPLILAARLAVVTALFFLSPPPSPLSSPTLSRNCSSSRDEREDESRFYQGALPGELSGCLVIHRGRINDPVLFVFLGANRKPISRRCPST